MKIPSDVAGWELFDMPGAKTAAKEITAATRKAVRDSVDTYLRRFNSVEDEDIEERVYQMVRGIFAPAWGLLEKHTKFGANDSEPLHHMRRIEEATIRGLVRLPRL